MATLDADPTSATFNCYATLAQGIDYHSKRLHNTAWTNAGSTDKQKALMWATRQLDTLKWRGVRTSGTQNLEFPRRGLSYYESAPVGGYDYEVVDISGIGYFVKIEISDTTVPAFLRDATCELAMYLLDSDTTAPTGTEGYERIKVDVIDLQIKASDRESWLSKSVRDLIWKFLLNASPYSSPTSRVG